MSIPIIQNSPRPLITLDTVKHAELENNTIIQTCFGKVYLKRLFLPFIGVGFLFLLSETHTFIYIPVIIFFISFIIFWNYPFIVIFTNSKPLYYEDLFVDTSNVETIEVDIQVRQRFEKCFEWSLIITNSLFAAFLSDYWLYQSSSKETIMEIIGITGGMLKIFQSVNYLTGNIILYVTHYYITDEVHKNKLEYMGDADIMDFNITENDVCRVDSNKDYSEFIDTNNVNNVIIVLPEKPIPQSIIQPIAEKIISEIVYEDTHQIIKDLTDLKLYNAVCEIYPEIKSDPNVFIELSTFNPSTHRETPEDV